MYILLAEDDDLLGDAIQAYLRRFGHTIDWAEDGELAREALIGITFDLVLLDIGLPKISGLDVLCEFRKVNQTTPVMLITAKQAVEDVIKGLGLGADDYIRKPFDLSELKARCEAVRRRTGSIAPPDIVHGDLLVRKQACEVLLKGQPISVTPVGYKLLLILLERPDMAYSREDLLQKLYGWSTEANVNAIDVLVSRLRRLIGSDMIQTVRGLGYKIGKP